MTTTQPRPTCTAITRAGVRCRSFPVNGTGLCVLHGPKARQIQREGGKHKSLQYRLQQQQSPDLQRVLALLIKALDEVHEGQLGAASGQSMAALGSSILKVREQGFLEMRIVELEKRAKADRR